MLAQPAAEHTLGGLCLLANSHKKGSSSPGPGPVFLRIGLFGGSLRSSNHTTPRLTGLPPQGRTYDTQVTAASASLVACSQTGQYKSAFPTTPCGGQ